MEVFRYLWMKSTCLKLEQKHICTCVDVKMFSFKKATMMYKRNLTSDGNIMRKCAYNATLHVVC